VGRYLEHIFPPGRLVAHGRDQVGPGGLRLQRGAIVARPRAAWERDGRAGRLGAKLVDLAELDRLIDDVRNRQAQLNEDTVALRYLLRMGVGRAGD
jgi:hypothetical protein